METGEIIIYIAGLLIVGIIGFLFFFAIVPAGHIGVSDTFGVVDPIEKQPGFHVKVPWTMIVPMSTKTRELKETSEVPSKEGLLVGADISLLYRIQPDKASEIYKTIGYNYWDVVIVPQLRSIIREVSSQYEAKALYTQGREIITARIQEQLEPRLQERGMILESVLLRELRLPAKLTESIESKLQAEQEAEKQVFILQREKKEAERKRIEAEGIKDAQQVIAKSLTQTYLQWYWIQKLNENPNVVYVATEAGLPLFRSVN